MISVAHEEGGLNDIRAILGNDLAVKAYREEKLPFPTGYQASMSADGQSIAYEPTGKAFVMWKRYRGGQTARRGVPARA